MCMNEHSGQWQLAVVRSLFVPCGSWGSDLGFRDWWQMALPVEPSDWALIYFSYKVDYELTVLL